MPALFSLLSVPRKRFRPRILLSGLVVIYASAVACGGDTATGPDANAVATVSVSGGASSLLAGMADVATLGRTTFTATAKNSAGADLSGKQIAWSTSNSAVATVDGNGVVTAVGPGTATITAASENKSGSATVNVTMPAVAQLNVSPSPASIPVGTSKVLAVTLLDAQGRALSNRLILRTGFDATKVQLNGESVTGLAVGSTVITYTSEGVVKNVTVTITP